MAKASEAWEKAHSFGSYADFLKDYYRDSVPSSYCAFWDLEGDGVEELLIGNAQGVFRRAYTIENGKVEERGILGDPFRVCEGGILALEDGIGFSHRFIYGIPQLRSYKVLDRVDYRLDEDR